VRAAEDPLGDLVPASAPDVVAVAEPGEYPVQDADAGGVPGQALVQADDHQSAPVGASAYSWPNSSVSCWE
jgi:hypothetical protein